MCEAVIIKELSCPPQYNVLLPNSTAENTVLMVQVSEARKGLTDGRCEITRVNEVFFLNKQNAL